jgi:hypothetical protein
MHAKCVQLWVCRLALVWFPRAQTWVIASTTSHRQPQQLQTGVLEAWETLEERVRSCVFENNCGIVRGLDYVTRLETELVNRAGN